MRPNSRLPSFGLSPFRSHFYKIVETRSRLTALEQTSDFPSTTVQKTERLRILRGQDPDAQALATKEKELNLKIMKKEVDLFEKGMVQETTDRIVDNLRQKVEEGR